MKYYSEMTKKFYESEADCKQAEEKELAKKENLANQRKAAAEQIDKLREEYKKAYDAYQDATKAYRDGLSDFCKKYGSYHYTVSGKEIENSHPWSLLEEFLNW